MKSINKLALLFAAATGTLASCSNEEALLKGSDNSGETVHMVVTAMRESEETTRTTLTDSKAHLSCKWDEGDRILVTNKAGYIKGQLILKEGDGGKTKGTFEGDLEGIVASSDGTIALNYYYLGTGNKEYDIADELYSHDFSTQNGTLASLTDYDIMSVEKTAVIKDGNSYVENIDLARRVSFARFKMNLPSTAEYPVTVTLSGTQLGNAAEISLADPEAVKYTKGDVVVTTDNNDFYITYLPTDGKYEITFVAVDDNDVTYTGKYTVKQTIGQNKYLRKSIKNDNDEVIDGEGVEVDMTEVVNYKIILMEDPEGTKEHNTIENPETPSSVTLPGDPNPNTDPEQEFKGWKIKDSTDEPTKDPWNLTEEGKGPEVTLVPVYETKSYQWQFKWIDDPQVGNASYGAKIENGPTPHTLQSSFPTDNPDDLTNYKKNVKEGYDFLGWEYNGKMVGMNGNTYLASEVVASKDNAEKIDFEGKETYRVYVYAKWKQIMCDVSLKWEDDEGNQIDKFTVTVPYGTIIKPSEHQPVNPTKAGSEFLGWVNKDTTKPAPAEITVKDKVTMVFKPSWKAYTVSTPGYSHGEFNTNKKD